MRDLVERALAEDLGPDGLDVTSVATIPATQTDVGDLVARADGVVAGLTVAALVFEVASGGTAAWTAKIADGARVRRGDVLATVEGSTRALLTAERTALNFLCHLSGVATLTRRYVEAVAGTRARILDTRKTTPGLRALEKAAVRAGGGRNHRGNLSELVLVKDNHLGGMSIAEAVAESRRLWPGRTVQVECDTFDQLEQSLAAQRSNTQMLLPSL